MSSLRARVVALVLGAIGLLFVPLAIGSYLFMMEEVDELFDARLSENAKTLVALDIAASPAAQQGATITVPSSQSKSERDGPVVRGHPYENQIGFQIWNDSNVLLMTTADLADLAMDAAPVGFADVTVNKRRWRVFTMLSEDHRWTRVGERYDSRREIGRALAIETAVPILIAIPLLVLFIGGAVHRGLQPLRRLAEQLAARRGDDPNPIGGNYPAELHPVVASLNHLLQRLQQTLESERAFTTNAAHELRTPLAGALVHLENALSAPDADAVTGALRDAHHGLDRLSHLVNQLLDLARWDGGPAHPMTPVDLNACVEEELALMGVVLSAKNLEVNWTPANALPHVLGWAPGLHTMLRNLLDNAVRYSGEDQRIDIATSLRDNAVVLSILDQGPGITAAQRDVLFKRFQRGANAGAIGAGIGLSLVARIAEVHRARIVLDDGPGGRGLRVEVYFPASAVSSQ